MEKIKNVNNDVSVELIGDIGFDANMQLPDPLLAAYYRDEKDRRIFITKDVDVTLFDEIRLILQWNREDEQAGTPVEERKPITIYLHSYGGDVDACFAMVDVLNLTKTPVRIVNMSNCLSAGGIIFLCGTKGLRYMMPNSCVLLHSGSGAISGTATQVFEQTENYKYISNQLKEVVLAHTSITPQKYNKKSKNEWYIYAKECVELGIADHIVSDIAEIL